MNRDEAEARAYFGTGQTPQRTHTPTFTDLYCAVCDHPFSYHKDGGECLVRRDGPWRARWCDCHSYRAPKDEPDLT